MERDQGVEPSSGRRASAELLGRYTLLGEIATGELTSIHLARQHGDSGFKRLVAVKRLKPALAQQPESVQLLVDEAQLTSGLHHANVIGCLDMGLQGGCYVVQNYVEGDNLRSLLRLAGTECHPRYVVPLIVDVLNGLHAVHTALDEEGRPLGLVHQAPHGRHVLVGIDGIARLCDFTQAKASTLPFSRHRNDRLLIASMAPEQALWPETVDHRSDLFVVGVLLWEALTGERLFAEQSEEQTFQNLLHRRIPRPSEVGRRPPRCLDSICVRALDRDPSKRYRSSLEMARELRDTALNQALYATTGEIGQWVQSLTAGILDQRRRLAGSEFGAEPSVGLMPTIASGSGFFQSAKKSDPYGSGMIFGGSYSRLDGIRDFDPDKTPAVGTRALQHGASQRARSSDPPSPTQSLAAPKPEVSLPTQEAGLTESLRGGPARPLGAGRAGVQQSPGAYIQVAPDRARPSASHAGPAREPDFAAKTGIHRAAHPSPGRSGGPEAPEPTTLVPAAVSFGMDAPIQRSVTSRPRPALDTPSNFDVRSDSTPARLLVPEGPVGSPYRGAMGANGPLTFEPPPMPRALQELSERSRPTDARPVQVDSLSPVAPPAHSTGPVPVDDAATRSNRLMWRVTGTLAGLILVAAFLSLRSQQHATQPARVTATQPAAPLNPGVGASNRDSGPVRAAAPEPSTVAPTAAGLGAAVQADEAARVDSSAAREQGPAPVPRPEEAKAPRVTGASSRPQPWRRSRGSSKRSRSEPSAIPDNPY